MKKSIGEICILVRDMEEAKRFYRDILEMEPSMEFEENRGTPGAFKAAIYLLGDNFELTLMAPTGEDATILNRTLEKRGEGLHHYCCFVDDMDTVIERCRKAGVRLVDSFNEQVKPGGTNAYTDPRATHHTVIQFRPASDRGKP